MRRRRADLKPPFWQFLWGVISGNRRGYYICKKTGFKYIDQEAHHSKLIRSLKNIMIASISVFITGIAASVIYSDLAVYHLFIGLFACGFFLLTFGAGLISYWYYQYKKKVFVVLTEFNSIYDR